MKKLYLLLSFLFLTHFAKAQNPDAFIMTFEVSGSNLGITVPIVQDDDNNYTVDFGDGTTLTNQTGSVSHTYSTAGTYIVSLTGTFGHINFNDLSLNYKLKLKTIEQWGSNQWTSMYFAFHECSNLILNTTDAPDLSQVTDMSSMFNAATSFNQPINHWNVSNVTNMGSMFMYASSFNQPLDNWDVSNVTYINEMFWGATSFNQSLNNWDVSNVTHMNNMFINANSFNQPLNNWDVSNVTSMSYMFGNASSFNQNLSIWVFNPDVNLVNFLNNSGLNIINYDLLLQRFATLELEDKDLGADGLQYCNSLVRSYLINNLGWQIIGDSLADDCDYNMIYGNVFFDENNNGCDSDDAKTDIFLVNANNGTPYYSIFPNNGGYQLHLFEDIYNVSLLNLPSYLTVTPVSPTFTFTDYGSYEELNFCLTTNQTIEDLNITLLPITEARPGFEADYQLIVQNIGTQTVNNVLVSLDFDNTMQSFVSAVPNPSSTTANQLNFEIASLSPFSSAIIDFTMETFTPPTVNGDDILNFTATVTPNTNDYTPNDNTFELAQIVVNSFDPNDKLVLQGSEIHIDEANEYLHYIVRFQNTGTASAINVRIEDTLHESLDWSTIQILNSSHNYRVEIKDGNQIEFIFNNINLPYEDEDEEGSNGFIAYKIKPIAGTQIGDFIIGNEAYIYFDYNLPIITNTTSTEVVEETSGVSVHSLNDLISVYPNPTNGILNISSKGNIIIEEVKIYNLQGRELFGSVQHLETISIENLSAGIYLMNIKTNQGSISKRVIKK